MIRIHLHRILRRRSYHTSLMTSVCAFPALFPMAVRARRKRRVPRMAQWHEPPSADPICRGIPGAAASSYTNKRRIAPEIATEAGRESWSESVELAVGVEL